ncbi:MAG: HIT domain-containing protein [Gemmatimonadales bacterium]|nr:HIT domain-containing protein [Gemmatimonadales bacterium]NIQ98965.1 HIT domain-containing protein [Gemmatimonadales bacterium]NIS63784.1 HIT domain-containing protein [Gemmatimonadales bacterium]
MADCVFCSVIEGRLPGSFVYRGDEAVAFLDLFPVHPGHLLIVPRLHVEDLVSCPPGVAGQLFELSAKLAPAVVRATEAAGFNVWTANGKAAGQEVFHLHLHLLPRFEDDTFGLRFPKSYPQEAGRAELDAMAETIRSEM